MTNSNNLLQTLPRVSGKLTIELPALGDPSAVGAGAPENVAGAVVVDAAAEHEEVVGEAVQVFECFGVDRLGAGQFADATLGAAGNRPRKMKISGCHRPARQDKRVERPQARVHRVDLALEPL